MKDTQLAQEVYEHLKKLGLGVYFSKESPEADYNGAINAALESAKSLIVVGSRAEHLKREWLRYEYNAFHSLKLNGRKGRNAALLSFIDGMELHSLPLPLAAYQSISKQQHGDDALQKMSQIVTQAL